MDKLIGLAAILHEANLLDSNTLLRAFEEAKRQSLPFTTYLIKNHLLSSQTLLECCESHFNLPTFNLTHYQSNWLQDSGINEEFIYRYHVIPLHRDEQTLHLGLTDPTDQTTLSAMSFHTGKHIRPVLVAEDQLDKLINTLCCPNLLYSQLQSALAKMAPPDHPIKPTTDEQQDEPVIAFVNQLLQNAISNTISDIHIEPQEQECRIRFRRDGFLYTASTLPLTFALHVVTRLKVMAQLNIAEKRLPQDGRIQLRERGKIDIRISTCPTLYGEKIALRLLQFDHRHLDIHSLGMTTDQQQLFLHYLSRPQGLILVSGPTGSGKTTTLYAALHYLNQIHKNISTVEDPVEIELPGINQVNIHARIGLDFATVLRTLLRQDPDIIMVGEMRDLETATIAMQAALTGHLVFSTLHSNHACEVVARLSSLGVATNHYTQAVSLIIAQRLLRKLCEHCKQPNTLTDEGDLTYEAKGCGHCHQGYKGRIAIFELLTNTSPASYASSRLWESGLQLVKKGMTSLTELQRVIEQ